MQGMYEESDDYGEVVGWIAGMRFAYIGENALLYGIYVIVEYVP